MGKTFKDYDDEFEIYPNFETKVIDGKRARIPQGRRCVPHAVDDARRRGRNPPRHGQRRGSGRNIAATNSATALVMKMPRASGSAMAGSSTGPAGVSILISAPPMKSRR